MKCHKLEVYGLLDSNKIYFSSFAEFNDGDEERERKNRMKAIFGMKHQKAF